MSTEDITHREVPTYEDEDNSPFEGDDHADDDFEVGNSDSDEEAIIPINSDEVIQSRRKYTFVNRKRKAPSARNRRSDWIAILTSMTEPKLRRIKCCKKLMCFKEVNYEHFIERSKHILSSSSVVRRTILNSMIDSNGNYVFDTKIVCIRFMKEAFRFGTEMLARDRKARSAVDHSSADCSENQPISTFTTSSSSKSTSFLRRSPHKDAIISFLSRLGEDCSERMPDADELHLPFFQKGEVYNHFLDEYKKLYNDKPPTSHYFMMVWKSELRHIKVRKCTRFTICDICEELRSAMREAIIKGQNMDKLVARKASHIKMVNDERMEYQKKRDRARLHPTEYLSIIVDGADQRAYGLPHFITKTKEQKGLTLQVKVIGLLEHGVRNWLHLYTMTEEHETGANHIVESIHRFLNVRRNKGPIPRKFFVQLDNCTRENKNNYLLSYLESLVSLDIFDIVEAGFLPKGHTHEDVDQCFSQTSYRLNHSNAITLLDLHTELSKTNSNRTDVCHLKRIANWSGLCEQEKCLHGLKNFTQYRYFKFTRSFHDTNAFDNGPFSTMCHVRLNCYDSWKALIARKRSPNKSGFLNFCPDLRKTPTLSISCPDGINKVTQRFISEEGRINNSDKMIDLQELRDFVFRERVDEFHWDISAIVETSRCQLYHSPSEEVTQDGESSDEENEITPVAPTDSLSASRGNRSQDVDRAVSSTPSSRFAYEVGSFVAIKPDEENATATFWIGKVVGIKQNDNETFVRSLSIHWFNPSSEEDPLQSQYHPLYEAKANKSKKCRARKIARRDLKTPWIDNVDTDTVIVKFDSLTKKHCLPQAVLRKLAP